MTFIAKHNLFSFSRTARAVKQWGFGWTVAGAALSAMRQPQRETQQGPAPGTYGLLVRLDRRG